MARAFLGGAPGPVRDTALLNAAAALAAEAGVDGPEGLTRPWPTATRGPATAIDSGAAADLLDRWVAASQRLAGRQP